MNTTPRPNEFICAVEGAGIYGRTMCAASDVKDLGHTLADCGLAVVNHSVQGEWAYIEYQGPLTALANWLPEHEIRRYWWPPIPAAVTFGTTQQRVVPGSSSDGR